MKYLLTLSLLAFPALVGAQVTINEGNNINSVIANISNIINGIVPIIIGLAGLVFIWGIFKYVVSKEEDSKTEAKGVIIWGIIILFVMISFWGLVNLLVSTSGLENNVPSGPSLVNPPQGL